MYLSSNQNKPIVSQMQRNMGESSEQIECIQIVKLHEKKGKKQAEKIHSISSLIWLFPSFRNIFFNLIWFPFQTISAKCFHSRHSVLFWAKSIWFYYFFRGWKWKERKKEGKRIALFDCSLLSSTAKTATKVRFIVIAFFNMSHDSRTRIFFWLCLDLPPSQWIGTSETGLFPL